MNQVRYRRLQAVLDRRQPDLTLLMERVHKPHNFSAILRNCDAAGIMEAHAVPPPDGLPLHGRTAMGAEKWVGVRRHATSPAAIRHLRERGFRLVAAHPVDRALDYRALDYTGPTALVLGAELAGLSSEALELVDETVRIEMYGMVASLNVSVAAAVLLFEVARQRQAAGLYDASRIEPAERERLLFEWGYPRIAARLRERSLPYPALRDDGGIADLAALDALRGRGRRRPADG